MVKFLNINGSLWRIKKLMNLKVKAFTVKQVNFVI